MIRQENKIKAVLNAIKEAKRFESRARAWLTVLRSDYSWQSKEGGACKRASMDLTRALAELRKARW